MTRKQKTVSKVLELKGFTREQFEAEVKKAAKALDAEQEKLIGLEQELKGHTEAFSRGQERGGIGVREMGIYYTYVEHLNKQIGQQKKCVLVRQAQLEEVRQAMIEAYKDERLMEILHDKIVDQAARATVQEEQKETDFRFLARKAGK